MALPDEQRKQFATLAANVRRHRERYPEVNYRWNDKMVLAVADHLQECEALLRKIADIPDNDPLFRLSPHRSVDPRDWSYDVPYGVIADWKRQIDALLGPAATEEKTE